MIGIIISENVDNYGWPLSWSNLIEVGKILKHPVSYCSKSMVVVGRVAVGMVAVGLVTHPD